MNHTTHGNTPWAGGVFGIETEYGFAAIGADGVRMDPLASVENLMHEVKKLVPNLGCARENDIFTANGSRLYIDSGLHPEVATPEVSTPEEAVLYTRAGDYLFSQAARAMERGAGHEKLEAVLWKANVDHRAGVTWASHESYLHRAPQSLFAEQLMSHLVTRVIYTGAGGFDSRAPVLRFVVSPRAFHMEHAISEDSTAGRGIFNTRDEPLAASPNKRLHMLTGESLWSETADYLRVGTTALLIAQIDAGRLPQAGLDLASPLQALAAIAADVSCKAAVELRTAEPLTALAIQRRLLESVEAELGAAHLPIWAASVCKRWRTVLDCLQSSPSSLVGLLDWPTKLEILKRQCVAEGVEWVFSGSSRDDPGDEISARLLETDMRFNRLDDSGIFAALDRDEVLDHAIVTQGAVQRALREPPSKGRARLRGLYVERLAYKGAAVSCYWDRVVDRETEMMLHLDDPFQSEGGEWQPLPADTEPLYRDSDPVIEPIVRMVDAGAIRAALRHMRILFAGTQPLSISRCRYCADVIDSLVPHYPVPVLHPDSTMAGLVLAALFERVTGHGNYSLESRVGTLLYRFHEAKGRYELARQVIRLLLARARDSGTRLDVPLLTSNLGYEYLLEHRWEEAGIWFSRALTLYEQVGSTGETLNVRTNLLECRFGQMEPACWHQLMPELWELNHALTANDDWRARKTLRLLARFAEYRGRLSAARGWMRKALSASEGIQTQLRQWDQTYLQSLKAGAD